MNADELISEIRNDKSSGASELMMKAIDCLTAYSEAFDDEEPKKYYKGMIDIGRKLITAQPSMAPLFNAVNTMLLEVEKGLDRGSTVTELMVTTKSLSDELLTNSRNALMKIQDYAADLVNDGQTILTHSYSSTAVKSLVFAHEKGMDLKVILTESRPLFEGRRTAKILSEKGINVVLIADMASFHFLNEVDLILTGCDCICYKGVVNKIGTKGLAIAASHYNIPFYILSEKSKFLPLKYMDEPEIEEKEPKEILEEREGIEVKNIYFDITPHEFIKGIVTENGIVGEMEVQDLIEDMEVCEGLIDI